MSEKHGHPLQRFDTLGLEKVDHSSHVGLPNIVRRADKTPIITLFDAPLDEIKAEVRKR